MLADIGNLKCKFQQGCGAGGEWGEQIRHGGVGAMLHVWAPGGAWLPSPSPHALQRLVWSHANETFNISL